MNFDSSELCGVREVKGERKSDEKVILIKRNPSPNAEGICRLPLEISAQPMSQEAISAFYSPQINFSALKITPHGGAS